MESDTKKAMMSLLMLPVAFILLFAGVFYCLENNSPYIAIVCADAAMIIITFALRSFFSKTALRGKVPYSPIRALKPVGSDGEGEMREIEITVSGYAGKIKFKLYMDGTEIADARAGDRFRISLTSNAHTLAIKDGVGPNALRGSSERKIEAGGNCAIYVWCNRNAKSAKDAIRADEATGGLGALEAEDAASYAKFERILKITSVAGIMLSCAGSGGCLLF